jgi:AmiR/NasT family two-component response regulator
MSRKQDNAENSGSPTGRVLVVADEMLTGLDYAHSLADAGYEVIGVTDRATEAVPAARSERPDLLIMDISLHPRFGIQAACQIQQSVGTPILFVTVNRATLRTTGTRVAGVLQKPIDEEDFLRAVGKATPPRWPAEEGATERRPPQQAA